MPPSFPRDNSSPQHQLGDLSSPCQAGTFQTTLDIVAAGGLAYTISRSLMTSLAKNRIDTHAFTVSLLIGKTLNWSSKARDRLNEALQKSTRIFSYNRLLWFGFSWKTALQRLLELEEGSRFVALSASLCECYEVSIVARILLSLLRLILKHNRGDKLLEDIETPSIYTIRTVIERFTGIFAVSEFGTMVEKFMSLDGIPTVTGHTFSAVKAKKVPRSRGIADPDDIAAALYELIQLASEGGDVKKVRLVGGANAVAAAAIGVWLFDLPTTFYNSAQEASEVVWTTCKTNESPWVEVFFSDTVPNDSVMTAGRVVYVPHMRNLIRDETNPDRMLNGRVDWGNALSEVFDSFHSLRKLSAYLGRAMGSVARIFRGLAEGDPELPEQWHIACRTYFEPSFGLEYVHFALERFPELKDLPQLAKLMQEYARIPTCREARQVFEEAMDSISEACKCKRCCRDGKGEWKEELNGWYCLLALASTIIRLVRVLSGIEVLQSGLFPKRAGLEEFYNRQVDRLRVQRSQHKQPRNAVGQTHLYRILEYVRIDNGAPEFSPLTTAHLIFSGRILGNDVGRYTSAYANKGICCFYDILREPSRDAAVAARICVISGSIQYQDTNYDGITDLAVDAFKRIHKPHSDRPPRCVPEKAKSLTQTVVGKKLHLLVDERLVEERNTWLEVGFEISGKEGLLDYLGPAKAVESITQGTGLVYCRPAQCHLPGELDNLIKQLLPQGSPSEPFIDLEHDHSQITIFRGDLSTSLIAACNCWQPLVLTDTACLVCAIHSGVTKSWPNFAIICSRESYIQASLDILTKIKVLSIKALGTGIPLRDRTELR